MDEWMGGKMCDAMGGGPNGGVDGRCDV